VLGHLPVGCARVLHELRESGNGECDVGTCTGCCIHEGPNGTLVGHVLHSCNLSICGWGLGICQHRPCLHGCLGAFGVSEVKMFKNGVNIRSLGEGDGVHNAITLKVQQFSW
jgi:hypothetical protein